MKVNIVVFLASLFLTNSSLFADTVILKNDKTIDGKIVEQTDNYIKMDLEGIIITYFNDEIKEVSRVGERAVLVEEKKGVNKDNIDEAAVIIEKALELSGVKRQIGQFPAQMKAQGAQYQAKMEPRVFAITNQAISESYKFDALYQSVTNDLKDNFDRERFMAVLNWLESPLPLRMSELEVWASAPEAIRDMASFAQQLQSNPPNPERLALAERYDKACDATDFAIEVQIACARAMAEALELSLPPEKRSKKEEAEKMFNDMRSQLELPMRNSILLNFLYTYRTIPDKELTKYLDFYDSDTGKWFLKTIDEALLDALIKASQDCGNRLIKLLPNPEPASKK